MDKVTPIRKLTLTELLQEEGFRLPEKRPIICTTELFNALMTAFLQCESPIERCLFWAMIQQFDFNAVQQHSNEYVFSGSMGYFSQELTILSFRVQPNLQIDGKVVRPDFTIGMYNPDDHQMLNFVIEADGFEYHSSQEQLDRDIRREILLENHFTVVRFTGTEIFRAPFTCVESLEKTIHHTFEDASLTQGCYQFSEEEARQING